MQQTDIPEKLLSLVYAAQTDPSMWQAFCDELNFVSSVPIMMFGHNLTSNKSVGLLGGGLDPVELETYHAHFADKNPWMQMNAVMPTGTVGISDQALERRDLFKTEFYNDWLRRQEDIVAGPFMMCHRTKDTFVGLAAACQQRNVEATLPKAHELLRALAPHLKRAINFSTLLKPAQDPSFQFFQASKHAFILLNRQGKVSLLNQTAENLLSRFSIVSVSSSNAILSTRGNVSGFIARLSSAIRTNDPGALPEPLFLNEANQHRFVMHAHMFPDITQHAFPTAQWYEPVVAALVIVGGHTSHAPDNFSKIAASFGATAAEQKLADALVKGQNLVDYADACQLSRHTVRNQMRALLHKSGCRNQVDFVRLIISLSSPFSDALPHGITD